jgi:cytochrome c oxidase assembly protein subunit 15
MALLVFAMVVIGGATRLTDSGLSITEWRPVTGAVPPLSEAGWAAEFEKYRRIPEYRYVNAGMSLSEFKFIYWWEWGHRFLGRIIGLAFAGPFLFFLATRRVPKRLVGRCWLLLGLGGLQGAVGWWMVSSGLSERVDVAPERLTVHLGLALVLFAMLVWSALDAWRGPAAPARGRWVAAGYALLSFVFLQCLLGGLVAGNDAGRVFTDWPLMGGELVPAEYGAAGGLWRTLAHDLAAVQLHHRLAGYLLFVAAWAFALTAWRRSSAPELAWSAGLLAAVVTGQMLLGIVTLVHAAPIGLGIAHQAGAVLTLGAAALLAWTVRRSGPEALPGASHRQGHARRVDVEEQNLAVG